MSQPRMIGKGETIDFIALRESRRMRRNALIVGIISGVGAAIMTFGILNYAITSRYKPILMQHTTKVQSGFADSNKLDMKVRDTDHDGETESYLIYDGKTYDLKVDRNGVPYIGNQR